MIDSELKWIAECYEKMARFEAAKRNLGADIRSLNRKIGREKACVTMGPIRMSEASAKGHAKRVRRRTTEEI